MRTLARLALLLLAAACTAPRPVELSRPPSGVLALRTGPPGARQGALLVLPGELALEYAPASLRLVAVRRGALAVEAAGGLVPAGEPLVERPVPAGAPLARLADGTPLQARLERVRAGEGREPSAGLALALIDGAGVVRARLEEEVRPLEVEGGFGFVRRFRVLPGPYPCRLDLALLDPAGELEEPGLLAVGSPARGDGTLASGGRTVRAAYREPGGRLHRVALAQPRGVRQEGSLVRVELDRSPVVFELSERFEPAGTGAPVEAILPR
jgi:hypothetical protein